MSILLYLQSVATKEACSDDEEFNAYDYCGGNYDDAYHKGAEDGEIYLARYLLEIYAKELENINNRVTKGEQ